MPLPQSSAISNKSNQVMIPATAFPVFELRKLASLTMPQSENLLGDWNEFIHIYVVNILSLKAILSTISHSLMRQLNMLMQSLFQTGHLKLSEKRLPTGLLVLREKLYRG